MQNDSGTRLATPLTQASLSPIFLGGGGCTQATLLTRFFFLHDSAMEQALSIMCVAAQKEPKQVSRETLIRGLDMSAIFAPVFSPRMLIRFVSIYPS